MPKDSPPVVKMTETKNNTRSYDVGFTMTTELIQKNSTLIKIEVFDSDSWKKQDTKTDGQILDANGTVDNFMKYPHRCGYSYNCIEVDIIWLNEREEENTE